MCLSSELWTRQHPIAASVCPAAWKLMTDIEHCCEIMDAVEFRFGLLRLMKQKR
jgi:hypothetical protein